MIEIESVEWRNFLSYGDYLTRIEIDTLGQCLILGEVVNEDREDGVKLNTSNGAGKSTIVSAIQYALFGRTMHNANPGDKIVNWFTGKDCYVKITMKNGDSITRLRNVGGINEIIYSKDGDENKLVYDTLSTAAAQQNKLNRIFNLDWDIFCGSVFFTQYGKPWLEMADTVRKKAIERILHIDRFACYAKVAKDKADAVEKQLTKRRSQIDSIISSINSAKTNIDRLKTAIDNYDANKAARYQYASDNKKSEIEKRDAIVLPDSESLIHKWGIIKQAKQIVEKYQDQIVSLNRQISTKEGLRSSYKTRINEWINKKGKMCVECEQEVTDAHTNDRIAPLREEFDTINNEINDLLATKESVTNKLVTSQKLISEKSPSMTIDEANMIITRHNNHTKQIAKYDKEMSDIMNEDNPHNDILHKYVTDIEKLEKEKAALEVDIEKISALTSHYTYIQKAYTDRAKVKSYIFDEHIPYINKRLKHYFDVLGLDISIQLNNSLGIDSNLWGYEFESGGERKRTDIAFMLAMFDLHELIYGRQCNVIVLDEVDGRLDDDGINGLVNIIKNDISSKVQSVIIISHKDSMKDMFHKQLLVKRVDRFSHISDIR